ncbi:hypothetical protein CH063_12277 [Colletotrichum higginsianum]|uniref:Globin-sensor domain-containing protein n=2 Tax=Colletotrichum higginsianum TaxID=80884 RepID=H1VPQ6_COLHI|nr:hypothetical protein CH63R_06585 [Colletotrichum higginsianum IMI 349063]OBR10893.1 hypothetical protein CH63R_06585 [Colletotrichum higginsianum IMI 349063]TID07677.1 hypothetical protein CH35J_000811 [Colletotrichum higginsianum]CCF42212.1 hypothetical protein CH063_12277 [Colletotrichum higginsianum]
MGLVRHMSHVDREELYTDLEARIRYLHSFLDFSSKDIEALISGAKYVKALIPAVVNIVYHKLLQYDITARAFTTRSTSFEGPMDEVPDDNSPQILHRKMFLRAYLAKLCSDPSKMEFWEYLDKVGMMHVGLGRKHPLHIEYIHLGACLSFIQDIMTEAILSHPRLTMQRKIALVKALGKVIWIQNDLMAKWHVRDGAEFARGGGGDDDDEGPEIEEEGYLHGRKILESESDEENAVGGPRSPSRLPRPNSAGGGGGVCPFTGIVAGVEGLKVGGAKEEGAPRIDAST